MSLQPLCAVSCPPPVAEAWSQPCVTSCGDSRAVIHPPPVVITFPGPILSSCSQESAVGSAFPSGMGNSFGPCEPRAAFGGKNFSSSSSCYSRYSYPCYSRNFSSYSQNSYPCYPRISRPPSSRPAKPGKDSLDEQTQQKKEQIQQKKEQIRKL